MIKKRYIIVLFYSIGQFLNLDSHDRSKIEKNKMLCEYLDVLRKKLDIPTPKGSRLVNVGKSGAQFGVHGVYFLNCASEEVQKTQQLVEDIPNIIGHEELDSQQKLLQLKQLFDSALNKNSSSKK